MTGIAGYAAWGILEGVSALSHLTAFIKCKNHCGHGTLMVTGIEIGMYNGSLKVRVCLKRPHGF